MPRRRLILIALALGVLVAGAFQAGYESARQTARAAPPAAPGSIDPAALLAEAWQIVHAHSVDRATLDDRQLVYGAVRGLIASLDDPHSSFADPRQHQIIRQDLDGAYDGIGISIADQNHRVVVVGVLDGSPAAAAGLQRGDIVLAIDGKPVDSLSLTDVVLLVRGPRGTTVRLTVARPTEPTPREVPIVRQAITLPTVRSALLNGHIGYVKLTGFRQTTREQLRAALTDVLAKRPLGLILDLRGNPGGSLSVAVDVASEFLPDGIVLFEEDRTGHRQPFRVRPGGQAIAVPLAVLVDGGSASAAEIVAGALQDHNRAALIGEQTYGKGSVQTLYRLTDGSGLRLTTAWWLTPAGRPINGLGLQPDLVVPTVPTAVDDPAIDRAIEYLLGLEQPPR